VKNTPFFIQAGNIRVLTLRKLQFLDKQVKIGVNVLSSLLLDSLNVTNPVDTFIVSVQPFASTSLAVGPTYAIRSCIFNIPSFSIYFSMSKGGAFSMTDTTFTFTPSPTPGFVVPPSGLQVVSQSGDQSASIYVNNLNVQKFNCPLYFSAQNINFANIRFSQLTNSRMY